MNHSITPKKVLIIEDEKSLRKAVVDILSLRNFVPIEAKNGKEGVRLALSQHPDIILLDLIMPEMDGMLTLKKIREDSWGEKVPVIILTNLTMTNEQFTSKTTNFKFTHYLIKSDWKLHDVVKKIEEILKEALPYE